MKKILSLILSALLFAGALFLVSCTPEETPSESESKSESVSESVSESASESESESLDPNPTYTFTFVDESGAPVAGVAAQMCHSDGCVPFRFMSNESGVIQQKVVRMDYLYVQLNLIPEGYAALDSYTAATEGGNTVYKVYIDNLNEATEFAITLKTAE